MKRWDEKAVASALEAIDFRRIAIQAAGAVPKFSFAFRRCMIKDAIYSSGGSCL